MRVLALAFIVVAGHATSAEVRVDIATCMPNGMMNSWREKYDAKGFWIEQHTAIEMVFQRRWEFDEALSDCMKIDDGIEKQKCLHYRRNRMSALSKCLQTAKRLCRAHGGLC